jgi:hypothetical protein
VVELTLVKLANRLIETFQKSETRGGDAGFDNAAVIGLALAGDEIALFHAVEETSHVRVVRNHAFADGAAGEAFGFGAAEDAEDIVLRAGETVGLEKLLGLEAQGIGGLLKRDKNAIFQGKSRMGRRAPTHATIIVVMTTNVKRKGLHAEKSVSKNEKGRRARVCEAGGAGFR